MGSFNFKGGNYCGGGYGKCFTFETDICIICGETKCTCDNNSYYDYDFEEEMFNDINKKLVSIQEQIIKILNEKYIMLELYKRGNMSVKKPYSVGKILKGILSIEGDFIQISGGYYNGFQIFTESELIDREYRDYEMYYNENIKLHNKKEIEQIVNIVNDTLFEKWDEIAEVVFI